MKKYLFFAALTALAFNACAQKEEDAVETAQTTYIASVNDEILKQADFELSETWLPDFVRDTDAKDTLNSHRFGALIDMMLLAQDAKKAKMLSDAETSLLIKEAQADLWIDNLPTPEIDLSDQRLADEIAAHPADYIQPARYTVSYALVHTDQARMALAAALGLMNGAQMGYNVVDPPELENNPNVVAGMPRLKNEGGHARDAQFFNFAFANTMNEKSNEACRLGPFSQYDDMLFSCDKAIAALKDAPLGRPIPADISCDNEWKAFVIPEWRGEAKALDNETARLHARQKLIEQARADVRQKALETL